MCAECVLLVPSLFNRKIAYLNIRFCLLSFVLFATYNILQWSLHSSIQNYTLDSITQSPWDVAVFCKVASTKAVTMNNFMYMSFLFGNISLEWIPWSGWIGSKEKGIWVIFLHCKWPSMGIAPSQDPPVMFENML